MNCGSPKSTVGTVGVSHEASRTAAERRAPRQGEIRCRFIRYFREVELAKQLRQFGEAGQHEGAVQARQAGVLCRRPMMKRAPWASPGPSLCRSRLPSGMFAARVRSPFHVGSGRALRGSETQLERELEFLKASAFSTSGATSRARIALVYWGTWAPTSFAWRRAAAAKIAG